MFTQVFDRLAITNSNTPLYSQAVSMTGANAVQMNVTVFAQTATNVIVTLQVSNDLENWTDQATGTTITSIGYTLPAANTAIAAAYVRVKVALTGTGTAVLAVGVNTAQL